ncbi:Nif3-like dinuclear metal center hexameric protein [Georgenia alba]|uniref:GTP cyclohydrolase 1 type 2 homolog n=1 Tax=Georgenia alba TaxID=2233858 RepID=A0ABW2Q3S4_9MICO
MATAQEITDRIVTETGAAPRDRTVDGIVFGDPATEVRGVATVMMPTLDALRGVVERGANLVVTHEPLFYDHLGDDAALASEQDPVHAAKTAFLAQHGLVVWRFHDAWHDRRPDGILAGVLRALGVADDGGPAAARPAPETPAPAHPAETTLGQLAAHAAAALGARAVRVVGDTAMPVALSRVAVQPGFVGFERNRHALADADVLIIGEGHEWEIGQYVTDAAALGLGKGMVVLGHAPSEAAGMDECARWLRTFLEEPVEFVAVPDPYRPVRATAAPSGAG